LSNANERQDLQVKVYVSFVLTAISWLILPVALLLACWGLPDDIKARSLHTVVTKPVRRGEVVIGRMLGFITVSTFVLLIMGGVGYVWIVRQIPGEIARTSLICRVPIYGQLNFLTREGTPGQGINVGDVWEFRNYIEGATRSRAIYEFPRVTPAALVTTADGARKLLLESRFEAFRSHKGDMDRSILCQMVLVNPQTGIPVPLPPFPVSEFGYNITPVDQQLSYYDESARESKQVDLFKDLVNKDGTLQVQVQCLDPGQYLGAARPDLFIRMPDKNFAVGYFKAIGGIWLMMALITVFGVTASSFLKGPVAALLTFCVLIIGLMFHGFLDKVVRGELHGGGPIEHAIRIPTQMNDFTPLDPGATTSFVKGADRGYRSGLWIVQHVIPDLSTFNMAPYVANGFDVPWKSAMLPSIATLLGYLVPCLFVGYYSLKLRELESK
jgi:hypothetical protein